jgi:GNAT superfamily N-acetyltransferase
MNNELISLLRSNIGMPLSAELAADIMLAADRIPALIGCDAVNRIKQERYGDFVFSLERIEAIAGEIMPLHQAHWDETEGHRHGLPFDPDYPAFIRYEQAGRYVLLTLRMGGRLLGNCAMYLDKSTHTQTIIATEDTLYLLPEARKGRVARQFVAYVESAMRQLGAREIHITVKTVNKAGRFFRMLGYRHIENGLMKILEVDNV